MADEKRQATRVPCELPIRLEGEEGSVDARMVDVSRVGFRLRIDGALLGVHRLSSLVQITRQLNELLGETYFGEVHPQMLGSLVRRELTTTRIAKRDWQRTDVEIGCSFVKPLSDVEFGSMGICIPPVGAPESESDSGATHGPSGRESAANRAPTVRKPDPEPLYQAFVYPAPGRSGRPLLTRTETLSNGTALLVVQPIQQWELAGLSVSELVVALDKAYGADIMLRIMDGNRDLWAGPACIEDVEACPDARGVRIGVTFGRQLRMQELGRLGLPTPA